MAWRASSSIKQSEKQSFHANSSSYNKNNKPFQSPSIIQVLNAPSETLLRARRGSIEFKNKWSVSHEFVPQSGHLSAGRTKNLNRSPEVQVKRTRWAVAREICPRNWRKDRSTSGELKSLKGARVDSSVSFNNKNKNLVLAPWTTDRHSDTRWNATLVCITKVYWSNCNTKIH